MEAGGARIAVDVEFNRPHSPAGHNVGRNCCLAEIVQEWNAERELNLAKRICEDFGVTSTTTYNKYRFGGVINEQSRAAPVISGAIPR